MKLPEEYETVRNQVRRFVAEKVAPVAHDCWRRRREVPMEIISEMAALGYFDTVDDPLLMCVVTEELSRGWLAVGSVPTRSIIAGRLIEANGTQTQKESWLTGIRTGALLCTAAFTEPNNGSDTATMRGCVARKTDGGWLITGTKTWITMANRAHLMTVLARTKDTQPPHKGLSMFIVEKTPGDDFAPPTLSGKEFEVNGYYGLKEYELVFEDLFVPDSNLLGGVEGRGFYQLMATYEYARLQTAARAVGVAQGAYDLAVKYAKQRVQFGVPIIEHQVIRHKLAHMLVELEASRQLTYAAARALSDGGRHDLEAGLAKAKATEAANMIAFEAQQIHGGWGYSEEYEISRYWRDARVLTLFEGTSEIQYEIIGKHIAKEG